MRDSRYLVVLGAGLTQFMIIGLLFSYGIFFKAFEDEFGWSRTLLSACTALAIFIMGVLAIFSGRMNDRFGPRRVLCVSGLLYGAGFVMLSRVEASWQLFAIFGTVLAVGLSAHDVVTLSTIARWFERRRGVMSGIVKVGTACGQILLPPIAAGLITWLGWRDALVVLGVAAGIVLFAAAMLMQRPPKEGNVSDKLLIDGLGSFGASFAQARSSLIFWTICAIQLLFFPALMTIPLHLAVHGMDLGLSQGAAAGLLSVIGAASIAGRLVVGALFDRIGGRNVYVVCLLILMGTLSGFALIEALGLLYLITALYGFCHGGLFVVVSPTVASYFGMRAHGTIFGAVLFFGTVGGSIGPVLTGLAFDHFTSYAPAFLTLAASAAVAFVLALTLPVPCAGSFLGTKRQVRDHAA